MVLHNTGNTYIYGTTSTIDMFKNTKEKIAGFLTAHPKATTYGISAGVALALGFVLSGLVAPHDVMATATNTARHGFGGLG